MPDIIVKGIDSQTLDKLKSRAKLNKVSLEEKIREVLCKAAYSADRQSELDIVRQIRASISNKNQTDSAILLREDRDR